MGAVVFLDLVEEKSGQLHDTRSSRQLEAQIFFSFSVEQIRTRIARPKLVPSRLQVWTQIEKSPLSLARLFFAVLLCVRLCVCELAAC